MGIIVRESFRLEPAKVETWKKVWKVFDGIYPEMRARSKYWYVEGDEIESTEAVGSDVLDEMYAELQTLLSWLVSQGFDVMGYVYILGDEDPFEVELWHIPTEGPVTLRRAWADFKFYDEGPESLENLTVQELIRLIRLGKLIRQT